MSLYGAVELGRIGCMCVGQLAVTSGGCSCVMGIDSRRNIETFSLCGVVRHDISNNQTAPTSYLDRSPRISLYYVDT